MAASNLDTEATTEAPSSLFVSDDAARTDTRTTITDANVALVARDNANDFEADLVRQRLLGSGPWRLGRLGKVYLLRNGIAYDANDKRWGTW